MINNKCGSVTLHWVKAHVGHVLNEGADRAAKFGTFLQWHYEVSLTGCSLWQELRVITHKIWTSRWARQESCRQTRLIFQPPGARWAHLFKLNMEELGCLLYTSDAADE